MHCPRACDANPGNNIRFEDALALHYVFPLSMQCPPGAAGPGGVGHCESIPALKADDLSQCSAHLELVLTQVATAQ